MLFLVCGIAVLSSVASLKDLYFLALFPMDGAWPGGEANKIAAEIALEHVNSMDTILEGYKLNMIWNDTKVGSHSQ